MLLSASNEEMSMTKDVCTNKCDDAMLHQIKQRTNVMEVGAWDEHEMRM